MKPSSPFSLTFFCFFFSLKVTVVLSATLPLRLISLLYVKASVKDPLPSLHGWDRNTLSTNAGSSNPVWCSWSGVLCNQETSQITSLDLSQRNLSGLIPSDIRFLSELTNLNLSCNAFDGNFPTTIFELSKLRILDVSRNNFSSIFPPGISKLRFLTVFNAFSNNFTGSLPQEIGRLRFLKELNLGGSYFQGSIPAGYGGLPRLKFLNLAGNLLQGPIPSELCFLTRLERLEMGYNELSGGIPVKFGLLSNLRYLDISGSNLSGYLPSELGNLTLLESLFLFKNRFIGKIPVSFSNLGALKELDLSDNSLSGPIPEGFSTLSELSTLTLMGNNLTGIIPDGIGELPNLKALLLWDNSLTGNLPPKLGSNAKLQKLDVSSNSLSGPIPPNLCLGNQLFRLILFGNRFGSEIPQSLANCTSLWRLRAQDNRLTGAIPPGFGLLPNLTFMDLSMNNLSGKIPGDLGNAESLELLNISQNQFGSEIPSNIWSAPNLQIFSASFCKLSGKIPDFIGCHSLYKLEMEGNALNGSIPWDIGHCKKLLWLNLRQNSLTGIIPWQIFTLPSITDVDLSYNFLNGTIPFNMDTCNTLENFNVSFNQLTGRIPSSGIIFEPSSFSGNEGLCGKVVGKPCASKITTDDPKSRRLSTKTIAWIMAAAFGVGLFILIAGSRWFHANYSRRFNADERAGPWKLTAFQRLNFTVVDVVESLSMSDQIIGIWSAGTVYKAKMPGGEIIAVKKLWSEQKETVRRRSEVLAEVEVLGNVRHRNIVKLLGCCSNNESMMLLYEYMPNGSLDDLLHGKKKGQNPVADWVTRYKIALGVAQGICYLHHDCHPVIVHRDLKPSNILLDAEMEARVADFGVANLFQTDESMSVIAGYYGYLAPEYEYTSQVNEKSDIYSFGVVLMEILSGKRSVDAAFGDGNSIVDWVRCTMRKSKDGVGDILDKNAGALCAPVREEMILVLRIALLCTNKNPANRPSMRDVLTMLHKAKAKRKLPDSLSSSA